MTEEIQAPSSQHDRKLDPESLVLRARPMRVTRFRRGAIIAIAAIGSASIASVTWLALKPVSLRIANQESDAPQLEGKTPADALAGVPRTYGDVPKLGPPLPGDLGPPILAHQAEMASEGRTAGATGQLEEQERERAVTERRSALQSGVMMQFSSVPAAASASAAQIDGANSPTPSSGNARGSLDPEHDPNAQQHKQDFIAEGSQSSLNGRALSGPASPYMLSAGSVIPASLLTGLSSDLPGLVTAQVTENVYDSATGRFLLLPQGSRLIGNYDSVVAFGQSRALVVWQRIIRPDGSSISIDNAPASDASGYAGLADRIDRHSWQLLKGVALSTLLGAGTELRFGSDGNIAQAIMESAQQSGARAGDQLVSKSLDIQPTIRVRPGWPVRVLVNKDIILTPWRGGRDG
jgi:type IV secretion system protein VirB10